MPPKVGSKKERVGNSPERGKGILLCQLCGKPYAQHELKRCEG